MPLGIVSHITTGSIQAAVVPGTMRSRVAGAYRTVNYGVRPLGALVGGLAGAAIGLRSTLWIGAAGALLCGLWLIRSSVVRMTRTAPSAEHDAAA